MKHTAEFLLAALTGLTSHWGFYIQGEHHLIARKLFKSYCFLFVVILFAEVKLLHQSFRDAFIATASIAGVYAATLFTSMLIYRAFFHRLRRFPGPPMAKLSKFYHAWKTRDYQACIWLDECHQKYGDFVRTGPTEITIYTPEAIPQILGPQSPCGKSMWWEMMAPLVAMVTTRSRESHASRRKAWDQGFSISALRVQEPGINHYVDELVSLITLQGDNPINVTELIGFFAFDVMGDINFGIKFNMTRDGKPNPWLTTFRDGNRLFGPFTPLPWAFHIATMIPGMMNDWLRFKAWSDSLLRKRLQEKDKKTDMIYHAINHAENDGGIDARYHWLFGDFITMVLAASEPPMSTAIFLMYHLAKEPRHIAKLREELSTITDVTDHMQLQKLTHMNALIDETLRLHPSVPSGGLRDTPSQGITVGSTYIPGNTTVLIPQYTLHRREDCFEQPLDFVPERWSTRPNMVKNHDAFIPFSVGNHTCLGKNLAKMEVRLLVARLVSRFDFGFAPGETGEDVTGKLMDLFTTTPGPLNMVFKQRDVFV